MNTGEGMIGKEDIHVGGVSKPQYAKNKNLISSNQPLLFWQVTDIHPL